MAPTILIATHSNNPVAEAVIKNIQQAGYNPCVIATDTICQGTMPFSFSFRDNQSVLRYGSQKINLNDVGSAWYWRAIVASSSEPNKRHDIEREMQKTLWGIWESLPKEVWLNPPYVIKRTQNKLMQLRFATLAGLRVIPTIATNSQKLLEAEMPRPFIFKMPGKGIIGQGTQSEALYSTVVPKGDTSAAFRGSPFPGMFQPFLSKRREWRVTIVGDAVFSAAIYTTSTAKNDWRPLAHNPDYVRFVAEDFPAATTEQCKVLMKLLGLRYGAFDFIESDDGTLHFVEINSNGQFLWLEKELGFSISRAIAHELVSIAKINAATQNEHSGHA